MNIKNLEGKAFKWIAIDYQNSKIEFTCLNGDVYLFEPALVTDFFGETVGNPCNATGERIERVTIKTTLNPSLGFFDYERTKRFICLHTQNKDFGFYTHGDTFFLKLKANELNNNAVRLAND